MKLKTNRQVLLAFAIITISAPLFAAPLEFKPIANLALAGSEICDYDPASQRIFVTADTGLQVVDLSDPANPTLVTTIDFTDVFALGEKDFSDLLADFSDRDGPENTTAIKHTRGNPVFGLYMPEAITSYAVSGNTYYVMANEGDDRDDFLSVGESIRVVNAGYVLDETVFPKAATGRPVRPNGCFRNFPQKANS